MDNKQQFRMPNTVLDDIKHSKFWQILVSLDHSSRNRLVKFVASPYFNSNTDLVDLLTSAISILGKKEQWSYERLHDATFPNRKFNKKKFQYLLSDLFKLNLMFLETEQFKANQEQKSLNRLKAFREHSLNALFSKSFEREIKLSKKIILQDLKHKNYLHQLYIEKGIVDRLDRKKAGENLTQMTKNLSELIAIQIYQHAASLSSYKNVSGINIQFPILEALDRELLNKTIADDPFVQVYRLIGAILENDEDETSFRALKKWIKQHGSQLPNADLKDIYIHCINYCIRAINRGEKKFLFEVLDLYKFGLSSLLLLNEGILSPLTYNNILLTALAASKEQWAKEFLEEYKDRLPQKEAKNIYHYNLAVYYIRTKQEEKSMELLHQVDFKEPLQFLEVKKMLLRIYYEKEEWTGLELLLDSLRNYLYRKNNLGYHRNNYLNLVKILNRIIKIPANDMSAIQKIYSKVRQTPNIAEREWLLSKLKIKLKIESKGRS